MDPKRRALLAAGAAVAATAAVPRVLAQAPGSRGTGKFYEKGSVRIYYEEAGSGVPLLLLPGGGLNATIAFFTGIRPSTRSRSSRASIAASPPTCATRPPVSQQDPSKSIGRGSRMPTISSD